MHERTTLSISLKKAGVCAPSTTSVGVFTVRRVSHETPGSVPEKSTGSVLAFSSNISPGGLRELVEGVRAPAGHQRGEDA